MIPVEAHRLPRVGLEIHPLCDLSVDAGGRTAPRRPIVGPVPVHVEAGPGPPEILEDPVRVDVAAEELTLAREVVAAVLVEVHAERPHVAAGTIGAPLNPVGVRPLVGPAEKAKIVDLQ